MGRAERKAKELAFAQGEDKKNQDRMSELASKLQGKIKTYKQQIEEAEEIAALNLASSARLSRSWRRPRREPSSPWSSKLFIQQDCNSRVNPLTVHNYDTLNICIYGMLKIK